mmetsp:Transcript_8453/g.12905  ORF Transcript_8453/g.12905 Transcript_8453/m.12905 type:complete len:151 (+) Transcript_8453:421-873(+)|eukprot:CAMPEP_0170497260 /NCGR_PEP_ID=MMETSP0208-20121228/24229_1 /TAXON_ID=197538 /ORGANISM="Strombidium inclinatum, Strain S3" /LENGTH=150 /DNA_ID=CAMNT_0010774027 /DNA_START=346 /DNA_END=798 /DNA_ORIENTATION=-
MEDVVPLLNEERYGFLIKTTSRKYEFSLPDKAVNKEQALKEWLEVFSGLFELRQVILLSVQQSDKFPYFSLSQRQIEEVSNIIGDCSVKQTDFQVKKRSESLTSTLSDMMFTLIGAEFDVAKESSQVGVAPEIESFGVDPYLTQTRDSVI